MREKRGVSLTVFWEFKFSHTLKCLAEACKCVFGSLLIGLKCSDSYSYCINCEKHRNWLICMCQVPFED